jgi:hypothetical protein
MFDLVTEEFLRKHSCGKINLAGVDNNKARPTKRALDAGDCRFVACGIFKHFSLACRLGQAGFEFFSAPSLCYSSLIT